MIPWRHYMSVAFGMLHLAPRDFWAMTPVEFWAALDAYCEALAGEGAVAGPPSRAEVEELMVRFPD